MAGTKIAAPAPSVADPKSANAASAATSVADAAFTKNILDKEGAVPTSGSPNAQCGTGGGAGPNTMSPNGATPSGYPNIRVPGSTGMPNAGIMNIINSSVPAGYIAQITPHGGMSGRASGTQNHPTGNAADVFLVNSSGASASQAVKAQYISNLTSNGATGIGTYSSGFIHADNYHRNLAVWGNNGSSSTAEGWAKQAAGQNAKAGNPANAAQNGGGANQNGQCGPSNSGCQPVTSVAPQAAAGMAQGQGLASPAGLMSAVQSFASNPMAAASGLLQGAAGQAMGGLLGGAGGDMLGQAMALGQAALSDPKAALTGLAGKLVSGIGSSIMPSITGVIPSSILNSGIGNMAQGLLTNKIQESVTNLFGSGSTPDLGKFANVFSSAAASAGASSFAQQSIKSSLGMVFGDAKELFNEKISQNNISKLAGGTDKEANSYIDIDYEPYNGQIKEAIQNTVNLIGPPAEVVKELIGKDDFHAFSSVYKNYHSLVTNGYGTLTNNIYYLGLDFIDLGKLCELTDLLRIGTAGQIARQIIVNGAGISSGLNFLLTENNITIYDLANPDFDSKVATILSSINNQDAIRYVVDSLEIKNLTLQSLGDLLDTKKILPRSYEYNYFYNINDIAVFLMINGGVGRMHYISDLGAMFESLEIMYNADEINNDPAVYNLHDITNFANELATTSRFSQNGDLTVADFIGSGAGYVHSDTLPKMKEILDDFDQNTTYFNNYKLLCATLTDTLNGLHTTLTDIIVPDTAGYTFGTYLTLDDATIALVTAIEDELTTVDAAMDPAYKFKLWQLDSLHTESVMQLMHEQSLREKFGIDFGEPQQTEIFISDGVEVVLPLKSPSTENPAVSVYIDGLWQLPTTFTLNSSEKTLTLTAPAIAGAKVVVVYNTNKIKPSSNKSQIWQFASNLEKMALETGFGGPTEFLSRVVSNDEHGQRITAIMRQARNKIRLGYFGVVPPGFDQANSVTEDYINFSNWTGIWSDDPQRAAETWVQNSANVDSNYEYTLKKITDNKDAIKLDLALLYKNTVSQIIMVHDDVISLSQKGIDLYNSFDPNNLEKFAIGYSNELPTSGIVIGPFNEIMSDILKNEGITSTVYNFNLSVDTASYLNNINVAIPKLVYMIQHIMLINGATYTGLDIYNFRDIFEIESVGNTILDIIINGATS